MLEVIHALDYSEKADKYKKILIEALVDEKQIEALVIFTKCPIMLVLQHLKQYCPRLAFMWGSEEERVQILKEKQIKSMSPKFIVECEAQMEVHPLLEE